MGCSNDWVITGHTETIQNTLINLIIVYCEHDSVYMNTTAPWGTKATASLAIGESVKKINPSNSSEYITIKCIDIWCTTTGNAAKIEVCHELPPECPIPICSFIIS